MKWKLEFKIANIGFIIAIIILSLLGFLSYNLFQNHVKNENRTKHTNLVIQTNMEVLSNLKDAETGQRGYIITGNKSYLEPYHNSLKQNEKLLVTLNLLTSESPDQQKSV